MSRVADYGIHTLEADSFELELTASIVKNGLKEYAPVSEVDEYKSIADDFPRLQHMRSKRKALYQMISHQYTSEKSAKRMQKRMARTPVYPPQQTSHVVLPDKEIWFRNLAEGAPLGELATSLPRPPKNRLANRVDLASVMESMWKNEPQVPVSRASWYIKQVLHVKVPLRKARQTHSMDDTLTVEVFAYMTSQLKAFQERGEILLQGSAEKIDKERFSQASLLVSKWHYFLSLCQFLYEEGLLLKCKVIDEITRLLFASLAEMCAAIGRAAAYNPQSNPAVRRQGNWSCLLQSSLLLPATVTFLTDICKSRRHAYKVWSACRNVLVQCQMAGWISKGWEATSSGSSGCVEVSGLDKYIARCIGTAIVSARSIARYISSAVPNVGIWLHHTDLWLERQYFQLVPRLNQSVSKLRSADPARSNPALTQPPSLSDLLGACKGTYALFNHTSHIPAAIKTTMNRLLEDHSRVYLLEDCLADVGDTITWQQLAPGYQRTTSSASVREDIISALLEDTGRSINSVALECMLAWGVTHYSHYLPVSIHLVASLMETVCQLVAPGRVHLSGFSDQADPSPVQSHLLSFLQRYVPTSVEQVDGIVRLFSLLSLNHTFSLEAYVRFVLRRGMLDPRSTLRPSASEVALCTSYQPDVDRPKDAARVSLARVYITNFAAPHGSLGNSYRHQRRAALFSAGSSFDQIQLRLATSIVCHYFDDLSYGCFLQEMRESLISSRTNLQKRIEKHRAEFPRLTSCCAFDSNNTCQSVSCLKALAAVPLHHRHSIVSWLHRKLVKFIRAWFTSTQTNVTYTTLSTVLMHVMQITIELQLYDLLPESILLIQRLVSRHWATSPQLGLAWLLAIYAQHAIMFVESSRRDLVEAMVRIHQALPPALLPCWLKHSPLNPKVRAQLGTALGSSAAMDWSSDDANQIASDQLRSRIDQLIEDLIRADCKARNDVTMRFEGFLNQEACSETQARVFVDELVSRAIGLAGRVPFPSTAPAVYEVLVSFLLKCLHMSHQVVLPNLSSLLNRIFGAQDPVVSARLVSFLMLLTGRSLVSTPALLDELLKKFQEIKSEQTMKLVCAMVATLFVSEQARPAITDADVLNIIAESQAVLSDVEFSSFQSRLASSGQVQQSLGAILSAIHGTVEKTRSPMQALASDLLTALLGSTVVKTVFQASGGNLDLDGSLSGASTEPGRSIWLMTNLLQPGTFAPTSRGHVLDQVQSIPYCEQQALAVLQRSTTTLLSTQRCLLQLYLSQIYTLDRGGSSSTESGASALKTIAESLISSPGTVSMAAQVKGPVLTAISTAVTAKWKANVSELKTALLEADSLIAGDKLEGLFQSSRSTNQSATFAGAPNLSWASVARGYDSSLTKAAERLTGWSSLQAVVSHLSVNSNCSVTLIGGLIDTLRAAHRELTDSVERFMFTLICPRASAILQTAVVSVVESLGLFLTHEKLKANREFLRDLLRLLVCPLLRTAPQSPDMPCGSHVHAFARVLCTFQLSIESLEWQPRELPHIQLKREQDRVVLDVPTSHPRKPETKDIENLIEFDLQKMLTDLCHNAPRSMAVPEHIFKLLSQCIPCNRGGLDLEDGKNLNISLPYSRRAAGRSTEILPIDMLEGYPTNPFAKAVLDESVFSCTL